MEYSNKLKQLKIGNKAIGTDVDRAINLLDGFSLRSDLIGVPQKDVMSLFDEYCDNIPTARIPHNVIGRAINIKYQLTGKPVWFDGETIKIYVEKRHKNGV